MTDVALLCAGAAQGLVKALETEIATIADGVRLRAKFGAVGALREMLLAGEPCDVLLVTAEMVNQLCESGRLLTESRVFLGDVETGIAVRATDPVPECLTRTQLRNLLVNASAIYFPDPLRATAGIYFLSVLRDLGVENDLADRFRNFPNGAAAMRELSCSKERTPVGCTQISEIICARGVKLVGPLPAEHARRTTYAGALTPHASATAGEVLQFLSAASNRELRTRYGFLG